MISFCPLELFSKNEGDKHLEEIQKLFERDEEQDEFMAVITSFFEGLE
jgi:hypothetical protein